MPMTLCSAQFAGSQNVFTFGLCIRIIPLWACLLQTRIPRWWGNSHCKCQKRYTAPLKSTYKISQTTWYLCANHHPGGYFGISISVGTKKGSRHLDIMKKFKGYTNCSPPETAFPSYINMNECVWIIKDIIDSQVDSWKPIITASRSWKKHLARVGQHKLLIRSNELCLWVVMHTCASDILNWTIAYSKEFILTGVKWSDCTVISHGYVKLSIIVTIVEEHTVLTEELLMWTGSPKQLSKGKVSFCIFTPKVSSF